MKKVVLVSGILLSVSLNVLAATPQPSSSTLTSASDILNLPAENRRLVLETQGDKYYNRFLEIAFNEEQPMSMRWRALMAAAEAGQKKSIPDLLKAGDHKLWYMRNAALIALNEVSGTEAQKLATKLLKDKALVVRSAAVSVMDKNLTPETRDLLWDELNQKYNYKGTQSLWIRHQIVEVLAQKPFDHELKIFADLLTDKDARVQLPAVKGLEKLTGVKLGEGKMQQSALVGLWKDYIKKDKSLN
ncbi:HEAT repeat domain-containing protein [Bdellovibrio sp. HCB2-146]|uniref:HEAT repeat domain-containing protein n=1 Tax=Bdellovibrio sp. HCB2-146 TaxID=3394362 RepID=UPI0039BCDA7D